MRTPPWLQSLIPRLQSLQSLRSLGLIPWLSRSLSRLLPPCPRRPNPRRPHQSRSEEVGHPGSKNKAKPPKTVPAEETVPAPAPEPAQPPKAPLPSLPLRGLSPRLRSPRPSPLG